MEKVLEGARLDAEQPVIIMGNKHDTVATTMEEFCRASLSVSRGRGASSHFREKCDVSYQYDVSQSVISSTVTTKELFPFYN